MTALQRILKINTAIAATAAALLVSQATYAKTTITLDDDLAISFSSGQLDTRRYQGEIFDAELLENGEIIATADRVLLLTEGTFEEPDFIVRQFEIDNLEGGEDDISINARTVRISNLHLGWLSDDAEMTPANPLDWQQVAYQMEAVEIIDENAGYALFVPRFATMPLDFDQLSDGTPFLASGGVEMPFMQILPIGDSSEAREFETWLNSAGLPHIELAFFARQQNALEGADVVSDSLMEMRLTGLFDLLIRSEFYTSEDAFHVFSDPTIWADGGEEYLTYLVAETKLGSFKIDMRDLGLLQFIEQTGEIPPYPLLAAQLQGIMGSFLPETGPALANAIGSFMTDSGALHLSATPDTPFRLEDFAAALFMPDFVVRQINLTAIHTP